MTVLVTGAAGQAGKAVIKALIKKKIDVCAMVHRESQAEQMAEMGVKKTVVGDMMNPTDLRKALEGAYAIYFICSAGNPDEYRMGQLAIDIYLNDVAEAVAVIAEDLESHTGATYELCGTENLKLDDVLHVLRSRYHREITSEYISDQAFLDGLRKSGADEYKQDMMIKCSITIMNNIYIPHLKWGPRQSRSVT